MKNPPNWVTKFLHAICHEELLEAVEGDLFQLFQSHDKKYGRRVATLLYLFNTLQFLQPFSFRSPQYYRSLYQTYFVVIARSIRKKKIITAMNITGLSMALLVFFCIFAYISHEVSYDRYHPKADRVHRMTYRFQNTDGYDIHWARMNQDWVNELPNTFPAIESLVRFQSFRTRNVKVGQRNFKENFSYAVDPEVFDLFDFKIIDGADNPLFNPYSVVLTSTAAQKYFDDISPIGQLIGITNDLGEIENYQVTGIIEDIPSNTHLPVHLLTSINDEKDRIGWAYTYILLKEGESIENIKSGMDEFLETHQPLNEGDRISVLFQPLTSIHLESHLSREIITNGHSQNLLIFGSIGIFLLVIASVNFINLNTIQSIDRVKEFGLRKYLGATKRELKMYFRLEAILLTLLSASLAFAFFTLGLESFEQFIGHQLVFSYGQMAIGLVIILVIMSFISAGVSGLLLSKMEFKQLANWFSFNPGYNDIQKRILLGLQFCLVLMLITSMWIVQRQFTYMTQKNLGYNQEQLLVVKNNSREVMRHYETMKEEIRKVAGVQDISAIMEMPSVPVKDQGQVTILDQPDITISSDIQIIDLNATELLELEFLAGSHLPSFLREKDDLPDSILWQNFGSKARGYLINEAACHALGFTPEEAIGVQVDWTIGGFSLKHGPIAGVIKNYHQESLTEKIRPVIMTYEPLWLRHILIKTNNSNHFDLHTKVEDFWKNQFPNEPLELSYLDEELEKQYQSEKQQLQLITTFTGIAIIIGFMGLHAMMAYSIKIRIKELAIRRVLGANWLNTIQLLGREYLILALIAMGIIFPLTYQIMNNWLSNYAYHISINGIAFGVAGFLLIGIIVMTLMFQIIQFGKMNPTLALKSD